MAGKRLSDLEFIRRFTEYFPAGRALTLIGFCVAWRWAGRPTAPDVASQRRMVFKYGRSTTLEYFQDLKRFRLHLVAEGYERIGVTDPASNPHEQGLELATDVALIERVGQIGRAAPAA